MPRRQYSCLQAHSIRAKRAKLVSDVHRSPTEHDAIPITNLLSIRADPRTASLFQYFVSFADHTSITSSCICMYNRTQQLICFTISWTYFSNIKIRINPVHSAPCSWNADRRSSIFHNYHFFEGASSMNINKELPDPLHSPPYSWNSHTRTFIRLTNLLLSWV